MTKKFWKISLILLFSSFSTLAAQSYEIDYYGVSSEYLDSNMISVTSDLYYTQLGEINGFIVSDQRYTEFNYLSVDRNLLTDGKLSFFTVITRKENSDIWVSTIYIINKDRGTETSLSKEYDSYYKILMESKSSLKESFISLIQNDGTSRIKDVNDFPQLDTKINTSSTETLAGTWHGDSTEQNIDKIVIMRGGRGFVIFKNGASMNISISVSNNKINITQVGKSNASFFPELPRPIAVKAALSDQLIKWEMNLTDSNTMSGTKTSLGDEAGELKQKLVSVRWSRK